MGQLGAAVGRLLGLMLPTDTNLIVVEALERLCTPTSLSLQNTHTVPPIHGDIGAYGGIRVCILKLTAHLMAALISFIKNHQTFN